MLASFGTEENSKIRFFGVALATLAPVTVIINSTLIASFIATKQINLNTTNFLIFITSIVDLVQGAVGLPLISATALDVSSKTVRDKTSTIKIEPWQISGMVISFTLAHLTDLLTVLIAFDRYVHMNPDLGRTAPRLEKWLQKPHLYYLIAATGVFAILFTSVNLSFPVGDRISYAAVAIAGSQTLYLVLIVTTCLYARLYWRIRKYVNKSPLYKTASTTMEQDAKNQTGKEEIPAYVHELFKTVLLIIVAFLVVYFPLCVVGPVIFAYQVSKVTPPTSLAMAFNVATVLSCTVFSVNASIVLYRNETARKWLFKQVANICCGFCASAKNGPGHAMVNSGSDNSVQVKNTIESTGTKVSSPAVANKAKDFNRN
eukprot:gene15218-16791_t